MLRLITFFTALLLPLSAVAKPLVADLSQYEIAIDTSFTGAKLILFGARQAAGDVVVVVRGPARDYTLREKGRVAGIWVNRRSMELEHTPDYYAVASSKPLSSILPSDMRNALQIGIHHLPLAQNAITEKLTATQIESFTKAFIADRTNRSLYTESAHSITFMGDTLFKTVLPFPDTTPRGGYTAETYLIYNGQIVGIQSTPLFVVKRGLDATIFEMAHESPALYGTLAILIAIGAGWMAALVFRKL